MLHVEGFILRLFDAISSCICFMSCSALRFRRGVNGGFSSDALMTADITRLLNKMNILSLADTDVDREESCIVLRCLKQVRQYSAQP
jgi:hypothetical protein